MSVGIDAEMPGSKKSASYEQLDRDMRDRNDIEKTDDRKNLCSEAKNLISTLSGLDEAARNLRTDEIDNFERAKDECAEGKTFSLEELNRVMADSGTEDLWSSLDCLATQAEDIIGTLGDCIRLIENEKETSHGK